MDDWLFTGERILEQQPANLLVGMDLTENFGTPGGRLDAMILTARALSRAIEGKAIGGDLWLTTHRFRFASHGLNWTRGSFSIFLPTLGAPAETDGLLSDQLTLPSRSGTHRFVVRNAKHFTDALVDAKAVGPGVTAMRERVRAELDKVGEGVAAKWPGEDPSTEMIQLIQQSVEAKETDAIQAMAILCALELFIE